MDTFRRVDRANSQRPGEQVGDVHSKRASKGRYEADADVVTTALKSADRDAVAPGTALEFALRQVRLLPQQPGAVTNTLSTSSDWG